MLHDKPVIAFAATTDAARAKRFYTDVLGLLLLREDEFALLYEAQQTFLRIQKVKSFTPQPFTALGWEVPDVAATMKALRQRGVVFETFDLPGQDASGIWSAPTGAHVAWFKDPDGNLLSIATPHQR